jgi:WD40 repeat protein
VVAELHQLVTEQRFTAVVGPSGSGKSSLVLAGLVPRLKRDGCLVGRFTPGAEPFEALSAALVDLATVEHARDLTPDRLRREGGLVTAVDGLAMDGCLVIVIDQLEELWTTTDDDERAVFAASLADLRQASPCVRVLATVRADWFDRPLRDPSLGPLVARATFGVTPMDASELYAAISEPAARIGVRFEAGLVGRLVSEALDQPGSLPLLQFALAELFDRRSGATITGEVYEQIGGLSGSLAQQAESLYAGFTPPDQLAVRRLFARLVTAGDGAEDTRRRARRSELVGVDDHVVSALVERRLLTMDRDRESREPTIEIAHEALLRGWPRLREWLDEDRDWVRELRALASAARLWESSGRDEADLYRGARLATASELVLGRADSLTPDEAAFLDASRQSVDAERIAAEERTRVRERQNRRLRRSLIGLGVVTVVALIAGAVAVVESKRADDQADEARAQAALAAQRSVEADTQRAVADEQRSIAEDQRAAAEQQRAAAEEQRTAAEQAAAVANAAEADTAFVNLTNTSLLERGNRQDLAALLAIEAYRIDPDRSRSALFSTFTRNVGFVGYRPLDGAKAVLGVAPLPDGTDALAALDGGRVVRFDIDTGSIVETLDPIDSVDHPVNEATMLRLSGDGRIAVLAVQGSEALTWQAYDVASGEPVAPSVTVPFAATTDPMRPGFIAPFGDASVSADGGLFAIAGGATARVLVFATADGSLVASTEFELPMGWSIPDHTASVLFDTDDMLWVGVPDGRVLTFDPSTPADGQLRAVATFVGSPWSTEYGLRLAVSDDGDRYLITFGSGAVSRIDLPSGTTAWMNPSGSENLPVKPDGEMPRRTLVPCRDVVVSSVFQRLYCADDFGSVFEQDVSTGARTSRLFDRQTGVTGPLAVSIDQRQLLASSYSDEAVAVWKLDGSGPIQRVIAAEEGSVASFGYNSTGSLLNSSKGLYRPSLWDPVTGVMTDPLESITIGTWADAPDRFWAAFAESADTPEGYIFTGGLYDTTTKTRVPNVRIEFGDDNLAVPWNDTAHHRMLLLAADNVRVFDQLGNYIGPTITIDDPGLGINTAQSSADGTKLVISVNGQTYLYDAITGAKLDVPPLPLVASVVSPNGVAVGSTVEGDLWIFDPDTLEKLDELPGLHGFAELLTLSADGTTLAAENESDGIRIYDVPSRTQLGENIPDVDGALGYFAMRPDGLELAIPYGELGLVLWDLDPEHWLDAACALAGRNLSQQEWDKYLGAFGEYHQTCNGDRANR